MSIAIVLLSNVSSSALELEVLWTRGFLLKPKIQEKGYPEEKLTKGGDGFLCKVYYKYLGLEAGYLQCWKDEFRDPDSGIKRTIGRSVVPVMLTGLVISSPPSTPFPFRHMFGEFGLGVGVITKKLFISGRETKDTITRFGATSKLRILVPFTSTRPPYKRRPVIFLDLGLAYYAFGGIAKVDIEMFNLNVGIALSF